MALRNQVSLFSVRQIFPLRQHPKDLKVGRQAIAKEEAGALRHRDSGQWRTQSLY
ncbi:hypothetical protein [Scytonema sp. HK-05]|uniref:hypothetical protein n=1 Tax=Scytonema sp. HK-05 TaxID=1137095 RepID=UPI001300FDE4|nr:hypothetical protein [Scytonema sp. HK-05]